MEKERYWSIVVYPDSVPENWLQYLSETGLEIGISPLHDKDKNIVDDTQKKPHYHILLCFNGPTTYKRVERIANTLNAPIPKRVISPIGLIRYFTHKDNPEKAQYNEEDIRGINGFDYKEFLGMSVSQQNAMCIAIIKLINNQGIEEYSDLVDYVIKEELSDMVTLIKDKVNFFDKYLTSKRHKGK